MGVYLMSEGDEDTMSDNEKMHTWGGRDTRFKGMVGHLDYRQHRDKQFNALERVNVLRDESDEDIRVYTYNEWLRNEWKKYFGTKPNPIAMDSPLVKCDGKGNKCDPLCKIRG